MIYGYDDAHCKHEVYGKTEIDDKLNTHDDIYVKKTDVVKSVVITQSAYNSLANKDATTLYIIVG